MLILYYTDDGRWFLNCVTFIIYVYTYDAICAYLSNNKIVKQSNKIIKDTLKKQKDI